MRKNNRLVILSPHPDDAVWSIGGAIPLMPSDVEIIIVTLFDGDPGKNDSRCSRLSDRWRMFGEMSMRRDEDAKAAVRLGCERVSLGFVDAAMPENDEGAFEYGSLDAVLQQGRGVHDVQVPDPIQRRICDLLEPEDELLVPLGFGGHVDHLLTHALARRLPQRTSYYADFPYYLPGRREALDEWIDTLGLAPTPLSLPCDWQAWMESSLCYRSQILRLFGSRASFLETLRAYAWGDGAEPCCRIWWTHSR